MLSYKEVYESEGGDKNFFKWIDPNRFLPFICDLVTLKFKNRTISGWWNGYKWVGLRIKENDLPIAWKRVAQAHDVMDYRMDRIRDEMKLQKKFAHLK